MQSSDRFACIDIKARSAEPSTNCTNFPCRKIRDPRLLQGPSPRCYPCNPNEIPYPLPPRIGTRTLPQADDESKKQQKLTTLLHPTRDSTIPNPICGSSIPIVFIDVFVLVFYNPPFLVVHFVFRFHIRRGLSIGACGRLRLLLVTCAGGVRDLGCRIL